MTSVAHTHAATQMAMSDFFDPFFPVFFNLLVSFSRSTLKKNNTKTKHKTNTVQEE